SVMPGSAFRSVALALLMSTIAAFGAAVDRDVVPVFAVLGGMAELWFAPPVDADSAARTGPTIARARMVNGSRKNFDMDLSKMRRRISSRLKRASPEVLPRVKKTS